MWGILPNKISFGVYQLVSKFRDRQGILTLEAFMLIDRNDVEITVARGAGLEDAGLRFHRVGLYSFRGFSLSYFLM